MLEVLKSVVEFAKAHPAELASGALFIWSEVLGTSEKFKSSSIYELVKNLLRKAAGKPVE